MPPKFKFTKDEMISAALNVARRNGIEAVTARSIAKELGVSTQPVFTCFSSMEEAKREIVFAARGIFEEYVGNGLKERIPFFGYGRAYLKFAKEEPNLYKLLFLTAPDEWIDGAMAEMKRSQSELRASLVKIYNISGDEADLFFRDLWLVVHSLATLIVTGCCPYTDEELGKILTGFSVSICKAIKEIAGFSEENFDRDEVFAKLIEIKDTKDGKERE